MLKNVCRMVLLVWAVAAVIGGLTTGQLGAVIIGAIAIYALL